MVNFLRFREAVEDFVLQVATRPHELPRVWAATDSPAVGLQSFANDRHVVIKKSETKGWIDMVLTTRSGDRLEKVSFWSSKLEFCTVVNKKLVYWDLLITHHQKFFSGYLFGFFFLEVLQFFPM
jgi:hypothetical protein